MKIKQDKPKHNHRLTEFIKVAIFALFLLMPFNAILSTTAYATFNPNATLQQKTTKIEKVEQKTNNPNTNGFIQGNWYKTTEESKLATWATALVSNYDTKLKIGDQLYIEQNEEILYIEIGDNPTISYNSYYFDYYFKYSEEMSDNNTNVYECNEEDMQYINSLYEEYQLTQITEQAESNAFYYAIKQIEEQPIFSWTKETGIYQTLKLLTNGFENNDNFIPVVLTYMFMVTIIYLILDIVITCIVWITHAIGGAKE